MFHKVKNVKPLKKYTLLVTFQDGTVKTYDISPLFTEIESFTSLKYIPYLFEQVKIGGTGFVC